MTWRASTSTWSADSSSYGLIITEGLVTCLSSGSLPNCMYKLSFISLVVIPAPPIVWRIFVRGTCLTGPSRRIFRQTRSFRLCSHLYKGLTIHFRVSSSGRGLPCRNIFYRLIGPSMDLLGLSNHLGTGQSTHMYHLMDLMSCYGWLFPLTTSTLDLPTISVPGVTQCPPVTGPQWYMGELTRWSVGACMPNVSGF